MKISLIIVSSILFLCSCRNYDFKISELKQEKLKFSDLPIEMKEFLMRPLEFDFEHPSSLILINPKESDRYVLEAVNTWVGPWVDYMKLIDKSNKFSYRINQGVPSPFFVFENKLYISNRFYIHTDIDDITKIEFICYMLK